MNLQAWGGSSVIKLEYKYCDVSLNALVHNEIIIMTDFLDAPTERQMSTDAVFHFKRRSVIPARRRMT